MSQPTVRKHPFHIVDPSPWPFVGSMGALVMAVGAVNFMHGSAPWVLVAGLAIVLITMFGWWRDVIRESIVDKAHTGAVRHGLRMGMLMFIASEVMFFVAFFWAYFHNALLISPVVEDVWPPEGIEALHAWGLPAINTVILITSGVVLMWGRGGLNTGDRRRLLLGLGGAVVLGAIFLVLQAVEYGEAAFAFTDGVYASAFYMATGFHGFHVFVGVCMLSVMFFRALAGQFTPDKHIGFEAAEWYWHFVDIVWVFLFVWIYWWVGL